MAKETQTCPRRVEGPQYDKVNEDTWEDRGHGLIGQASVGRSCSYCGSLEPGRFLELVREGWLVGPTDKTYKAYLAQPYTDDELAERKRKWLEGDPVARAIREVGEQDGKGAEQIAVDLDRHWAEHMSRLSSGKTEAKFYFQHLSDEQQQEFIDLLNGKHVRFGWPGGFTVLPFFCTTRKPTGGA